MLILGVPGEFRFCAHGCRILLGDHSWLYGHCCCLSAFGLTAVFDAIPRHLLPLLQLLQPDYLAFLRLQDRHRCAGTNRRPEPPSAQLSTSRWVQVGQSQGLGFSG